MKREVTDKNTVTMVPTVKVKCEKCAGHGERNGRLCVPCGGVGWIYRKEHGGK